MLVCVCVCVCLSLSLSQSSVRLCLTTKHKLTSLVLGYDQLPEKLSIKIKPTTINYQWKLQ